MAITPAQLTEVRALIPDDSPQNQVFSDEQISAIFDGSGKGSVARTVGWACMALGGSDLIIGKNIRNDEISTQGNLTAAEWRLRAREYWGYANDEDAATGSDDYFDLVDPGPLTYRPAELAPWPVGLWD